MSATHCLVAVASITRKLGNWESRYRGCRARGNTETADRSRTRARPPPELDKTYTVTFSDEGWRIHFQPDIAPHFGIEPGHSLREVIERVEELYPEYCARLTGSQEGQLRQEQGIVTELHEAELEKELERTRRAAGSVGVGLLGGRGSDVRELQKAAPER